MDFQKASKYVLNFGKYQGQTIDEIAMDTRGLKYLDWLRGEMEFKNGDDYKTTYQALCIYLDDPTIASELRAALRR